MRVIITGGAGFLGQQLARALLDRAGGSNGLSGTCGSSMSFLHPILRTRGFPGSRGTFQTRRWSSRPSKRHSRTDWA